MQTQRPRYVPWDPPHADTTSSLCPMGLTVSISPTQDPTREGPSFGHDHVMHKFFHDRSTNYIPFHAFPQWLSQIPLQWNNEGKQSLLVYLLFYPSQD